MEDFLKDDEFAQFTLNQHYNNTHLTNEEKIEQASSSIEEFAMALEAFKNQVLPRH